MFLYKIKKFIQIRDYEDLKVKKLNGHILNMSINIKTNVKKRHMRYMNVNI